MLFLRLRPLLLPGTLPLTRAFTLTQILSGRGSEKLPPRPRTVDESEITEVFLKGSGPGGQKINKTSSAVQLIHKPTGIVVKCQETRSRSQNRKIARQLLAEKLDIETNGPHSYAMQKIEMEKRRKASSQKKRNRKYREPVEWPADPVDELVKDKNKIYVNRIVEEAVQGEEVMKRKGERINIQSKPMKPQRWDQMCPGIYEVAREGGVEGWNGVKTGVDEDKVVLCYRGYSGADLDKIAEEAKREEQFMGTLRGEWVEEVKEYPQYVKKGKEWVLEMTKVTELVEVKRVRVKEEVVNQAEEDELKAEEVKVEEVKAEVKEEEVKNIKETEK